MIFEVSHKTVYRYASPVAQSHHLVHLTPRPHERQRIIRYGLAIAPNPALRTDFTDYFGNPAVAVAIENSHSELLIHSRILIDITAPPDVDIAASAPWETVARQLAGSEGPQDLDVVQYIPASHHTPPCRALFAFAEPSFPPSRPILACAMDLCARIYGEFAYDSAATDVATAIPKILKIRRGVCQDFAHLLLAAMRIMGLPARYVSGYLLTRAPAGKPKLIGSDASHAWVSVWAPEIGWVDFDPTNDMIPRDEHITIAYGRDFQDVSPVAGVLLGGGAHHVDVAVDVAPVLSPGAPGASPEAGRPLREPLLSPAG
jgi:transglutaminase-like putative cysteine protease